jgi:hypothetical protein
LEKRIAVSTTAKLCFSPLRPFFFCPDFSVFSLPVNMVLGSQHKLQEMLFRMEQLALAGIPEVAGSRKVEKEAVIQFMQNY